MILENNREQSSAAKNQNFTVMLPCEPSQFGAFVSSLLGRPQTIYKPISGPFEINKDDIQNIHQLIEQRLHQQNDASLIQFTAKIFYDDNSSVLLNTVNDLIHYNEVKPLLSVGVRLSWTYLIKFRNKDVPEKQEITIYFGSETKHHIRSFRALEFDDSAYFGRSGIMLEIKHTDRTWGEDIISLLSGNLKNLKIKVSATRNFVYENSSTIGFLSGLLMFLIGISGAIFSINAYYRELTFKFKKISELQSHANDMLSAKINFMLDLSTNGDSFKFTLAIIALICVFLIVSIIFGVFIGEKADSRPKSFILLSKLAEKDKSENKNKPNRDWSMFILSLLGGVFSGIVANFIFLIYFTNT
ncbi:MAG: hypothetical protein Q7T96_16065 [Methylobacter sp.]|nr:hypothetical protein [Methylobacter sp.]